MADVINMLDRKRESVSGEKDFAELVERYMGNEAKEWLIGLLMDIGSQMEETEQELEWLKARHQNMCRELDELTGSLRSAVDPEEVDLEKADSICRDIQMIVVEELERG